MKSLQQDGNDFIGPQICHPFNRPIADTFVGVVNTSHQNLAGTLWLNAPIAKQPERPQSPNRCRLICRLSLGCQLINCG